MIIATGYTILQFNSIFGPFVSFFDMGILEMVLSVILFISVLILRTSVIEFTNQSPFPKWIRRIAQAGLYLSGMISTFVFFDGYQMMYNPQPMTDPRAFLILLMFAAIFIKTPGLYRAYHSLITHNKFMLDLRKDWFN